MTSWCRSSSGWREPEERHGAGNPPQAGRPRGDPATWLDERVGLLSIDPALISAVETTVGLPWDLEPLGGSNGRTFLAGASRDLVVRLDADPAVMARLSDLGLTPALVASGAAAGRTFVVQHRIPGEPLSSRGLAAHWEDAAALLRRLHEDIRLAGMARPLSPAELVETSRSRLPIAHPARAGARELLARSDRLGARPQVATHGDPNAGNFLFDGKLWLVDWDELRLADPLRDVGQVAWWYLDRAMWPAFLTAAGMPFDNAAMERLFWWVAAESLDVAVRLLPSDPESASPFLGDMAAALAHQPNPRRRPAG